MICNTMIEQAEHARAVLKAIQRYRELITQAFSRALFNGFPDMSESVVRARSEFLFGALLGLFVQKKMGAEGRLMQTLVDEMMAAVRGEG